MTEQSKKPPDHRPSPLLSVGIFLLMTGLMAYLRLYVFRDQLVMLTYGLPLLVCLWHRDRWLLWGMAVAFTAMAFIKAFYFLPDFGPNDHWEPLQWVFQVVNILVIAGSIHAILHYTSSLQLKNAELEAAGDELQAQAEELTQQNEEIQQQSEELQQQSEELRQQIEESEQQNEELQQQSEELSAQTEELQGINEELKDRERMLQTLMKTAGLHGTEQLVLEDICAMVLQLVGPGMECAAVVEMQESELVVRAQSGLPALAFDRWPIQNSLAAIAIEHGRTACVHDLLDRPDLIVPHAPDVDMRSSMVTPIRIDADIVGVMEVHSTQPRVWTTRDFQLLEWAAMQSGLIMHIQRLRRGLEKLVDERTARLQELVDELEHFSYSITHDMRAPLRAMQGFAGILMKECTNLNEKQVQYLGHIVESASRMDRLITDALNYAKTVRTDLRLGRVDAQRLFEGIIKSYPNLQPPHARVDLQGTLPPVLANEAGLTQCFANLLNNAVKFVHPGQQPRVTVRAEKHDGSVRFWIEDDGIGISPEFQPYLFQMFRRGSPDYDGTGIGLALVKKTCERMNGKVGVISDPGKGSRFWITLQAADGSTTPDNTNIQ
jgi:signal transduction histidine kinase